MFIFYIERYYQELYEDSSDEESVLNLNKKIHLSATPIEPIPSTNSPETSESEDSTDDEPLTVLIDKSVPKISSPIQSVAIDQTQSPEEIELMEICKKYHLTKDIPLRGSQEVSRWRMRVIKKVGLLLR